MNINGGKIKLHLQLR